jgi:membrane-bound ClpP family serine protease
MLPWLTGLSPNLAVLLLTLGLAFLAVELNRPGWIVPGALGLVLSLLSTASLLSHHPSADAALGALLCLALLAARAWRSSGRLTWTFAALVTIPLIFTIRTLIPPLPGPEISPWAAVLCGLALGIGTTVLTRIARRARQNKGLD